MSLNLVSSGIFNLAKSCNVLLGDVLIYLFNYFIGKELQEAREALARDDSSSSDSEDENGSKKKKDQFKPTEEVGLFYLTRFY